MVSIYPQKIGNHNIICSTFLWDFYKDTIYTATYRKNPKKPRRGFVAHDFAPQSLVCYTFAKERATRVGSTLPVPTIK